MNIDLNLISDVFIFGRYQLSIKAVGTRSLLVLEHVGSAADHGRNIEPRCLSTVEKLEAD